ncbi:MAG TPA: sulfatase, partial [Verrucomicrobiales bacterium]|nr:sulfatase [Verrucomicrobiales bacterium]
FYDFYWGSGFLPTRFQGSKFRGSRDPVLYLKNPAGMKPGLRRGLLDDLAELNEIKFQQTGDPEIRTRIAQYEMA